MKNEIKYLSHSTYRNTEERRYTENSEKTEACPEHVRLSAHHGGETFVYLLEEGLCIDLCFILES